MRRSSAGSRTSRRPIPTSLFNLFGLLPYQVPDLLHVGVWPLIMGVTMWVQMQLNPQQPDPVQQKIFNWMPVIFTFMLASFPSGLVIYWAWNNVLSLLQQYTIMRKNNTEVHLWKNLGVEKWKGRVQAAKAFGTQKSCPRQRGGGKHGEAAAGGRQSPSGENAQDGVGAGGADDARTGAAHAGSRGRRDRGGNRARARQG